jgi:hypothetical protein
VGHVCVRLRGRMDCPHTLVSGHQQQRQRRWWSPSHAHKAHVQQQAEVRAKPPGLLLAHQYATTKTWIVNSAPRLLLLQPCSSCSSTCENQRKQPEDCLAGCGQPSCRYSYVTLSTNTMIRVRPPLCCVGQLRPASESQRCQPCTQRRRIEPDVSLCSQLLLTAL